MANTSYSLAKAFAAIETQLINSMIRNMKRHRAEETDEGIQWSQWQAEQLKALETYRKANKKNFGERFEVLNGRLGELLRVTNEQGMMDQEEEILNAIKNGFTGYKRQGEGISAEFFRTNERKLNALVKATTDDMQKAETAVLRMSNDQYRKIIYNAQVFANTGAGTYEQAVDMATKDMLSAGLNCVQYANGSRHTLSDYADMAIRTANKRAYLQGEGTKRQEWGEHLVIMAKRGNPCPKCLPFVGKILIDDVWSGGSRKDGKYPLMSTAIKAGLYHPRCKDSHTTYFPGITTAKGTWTKEELEAIEKDSKEEARQQYAERQEEKYTRLANGALDEDNRDKYSLKADKWGLEQKNRGEKVFITDQAIDKVQRKELTGLMPDENSLVYETHKGLLTISKERNNSDEVACVVNLLSRTTSGYILGAQNNIDVMADTNAYHMLRSTEGAELVLCHNHPGLSDFSANDIAFFVTNFSLRAMTIVTNLGAVRYLVKKEKFDYAKAAKLMRDAIADSNGDREAAVERFLKKCYSVGIVHK